MKEVPLEYQIIPQPLSPAAQKDLEKQIAEYERKALGALKLKKLTPTRKKQVERLLKKGEDPFPVALYFKLPFNVVAEIANELLAARGVKEQIPTSLPEYLKLAFFLGQQKQRAQAAQAASPDEKE